MIKKPPVRWRTFRDGAKQGSHQPRILIIEKGAGGRNKKNFFFLFFWEIPKLLGG